MTTITPDTTHVAVADTNEFDVLATHNGTTPIPTDDSEQKWNSSVRGLKDDVKQQAQDAKTQTKGKIAQLQEQVIGTAKQSVQLAKDKVAQLTGNKKIAEESTEELLAEGEEQVADAKKQAKGKVAQLKEQVIGTAKQGVHAAKDKLTGSKKSTEDAESEGEENVKEQAAGIKSKLQGKAAQLKEQTVGSAKQTVQAAKEKAAQLTGNKKIAEASTEELVSEAEDAAEEGWEEVKRRGHKAVKEGERQLDAKFGEQKAKLNKAQRDVKQAGAKAEGKVNGLVGKLLSAPQLRPVRRFVEKNNLQLPLLALAALMTLLISLSLIRTISQVSSPAQPEFDIHSLEASKAWAKHHAGEYKNQALDVKESLSSRAAHFLANTPNVDSIRTQAVDWKDIGMNKLGLQQPTWTEWAMHYVTGRPITWQGRVMSVVSLTKKGLKAYTKPTRATIHRAADYVDSKLGASEKLNGAKSLLGRNVEIREPTLLEKAQSWITGKDASTAARAEAEARLQAESLSGRVGAAADSLKASLYDGVESLKARIPGSADAKAAAESATHRSTLDKVTDSIKAHIPGSADVEAASHRSTLEKVTDSIKAHIPGTAEAKHAAELAQAKLEASTHRSTLDKVTDGITDGIESIKAHIPGTAEAKHAAELAQAKLHAATHRSTLDKVASRVEYIKNRIVHGAEEAEHIAHDKANRVMDEAKLKTGL